MPSSEFKVNLLWLSDDKALPNWALGDVFSCTPTPSAIFDCLSMHLPDASADAWLFWDGSLGVPSTEWIQSCLAGPADTWHAGLRLGLAGPPGMLSFL